MGCGWFMTFNLWTPCHLWLCHIVKYNVVNLYYHRSTNLSLSLSLSSQPNYAKGDQYKRRYLKVLQWLVQISYWCINSLISLILKNYIYFWGGSESWVDEGGGGGPSSLSLYPTLIHRCLKSLLGFICNIKFCYKYMPNNWTF